MRKFLALWNICVFHVIFFAPLLFASTICENYKIDLQNGKVHPARYAKTVFSDHFDKNGVWAPANFQNRLKIDLGAKYEGKSCLIVSGKDLPKIDTAWNIRTRPFPISTKGSEFVLRFSIQSPMPVNGSANHGGRWESRIEWIDANGKECGQHPFSWASSSGTFSEISIRGFVPKETASAIIQFGFDSPNIDEGNILFLRDVELDIVDPSNIWRETGWFISDICPGGNISWTADVPQGSAIKFQISVSNKMEKGKNEWTSWYGPDGTEKSFYEKPFQVNAPWVRYKVFLVPAEKAAPVLKSVSIGKRIDSSWTFRRDMFAPRVKIVSDTPVQNVRTNLVLEITDDTAVFWNTLKIRVDDKDLSDQFLRKENRLTYIPRTDWAPGLHRVDVEISDCYENINKAKKCFYIGKAPSTPKITLRDDGITLIGDKPFFPIGIYSVMKREFNDFNFDKAFKDLKEAGFNFAHSYNAGRSDEFLAAADKYGFKLWTAVRFPDERFLEIERHHPAIIAWYLGDDTSANTTVEELYDRDDAVKAADPTRLTTQADPVRAKNTVSNYQDYVKATDTFLPEIYPVKTLKAESGENCAAQIILDMERCRSDITLTGAAPRAIWPIIQYFKGWGWQRFPTYKELRAMSFAALVHGANGITWYTYGGTVEPKRKKFNYGITTSPEQWNNISAVAKQIRDLSPVLLERTPKGQPRPIILDGPKKDPLENDSISCLLKYHDGAAYLICVNSSPKTVKAEFRLSKIKKVENFFEKHDFSFKNGSLIDTFSGHDVHVFKLVIGGAK
ncbi:MAG: hypothetical protein Q4G69_10460 [Planctomycetia bacterium]|nr:hypothetical protein [Planctomycetia bacterium]